MGDTSAMPPITNECGKKKDAKKRYRNWLIGLVISFIPLLALPLSEVILGNMEQNFVAKIFISSEIIFIGISLSIASLNDYINSSLIKGNDTWTWINIVAITLGAMVYGVTTISQNLSPVLNKTINGTFVIMLNVTFLVLILIIGSYKYISEICGGDDSGK